MDITGSAPVPPSSSQPGQSGDPNTQRNPAGPKHRYGLLVSYVGTGYQGMQINPGCKTIEADLCKAVHAAGLISDANFQDGEAFAKIGWNRAARTDKGVHAAGGMVSLKMRLRGQSTADATAAINEHLPPCIRLITMTRVAKRFNSKLQCESRIYEYLLPTFLFAPPPKNDDSIMRAATFRVDKFQSGAAAASARREGWAVRAAWERRQRGAEAAEHAAVERVIGRDSSGSMVWVTVDRAAALTAAAAAAAPAAPPAPPLAAAPIPSWEAWTKGSIDASAASCYAYRTGPAAVARLRAALNSFVGTRNYHNMTSRHAADDPRVMRYVMSFTSSEPFVLKNKHLPQGCEFVRLNVLGQSFIIYQIRKMIGAAILIASGRAPLYAMTSISQHLKCRVPTAPPTGLFLDRCVFTGYNRRTTEEGSSTAGDCESLDFDLIPALKERREAFKVDSIIASIAENMKKERPFVKWVRMMQLGASAKPRPASKAKKAAAAEREKGKEKAGKGGKSGKMSWLDEDWHLLTLGKAHAFHATYWASVVARSQVLRLHLGVKKRRNNMHRKHIADLASGKVPAKRRGPKRLHNGGDGTTGGDRKRGKGGGGGGGGGGKKDWHKGGEKRSKKQGGWGGGGSSGNRGKRKR